MTIKKLIIAAALAAPAAIGFSAPASAQAIGAVAAADPAVAIAHTKALAAAREAIKVQFKDTFTQLDAKNAELQKVLAQLDKNGDKQVDDDELSAAEQSKNPAYTQYQTLETEKAKISVPIIRATAFALEMILQRYDEAQKNVVTSKKIGVILAPQAFVYAPESADVTSAITDAINALVPSVPITAPANWNPTQATMSILQQVQRIAQIEAAQQAQAAAPAATAPAAAGKPAQKPQSR